MRSFARILRIVTIAGCIALAAMIGPSQAAAAPVLIYANVGPGFTITLKTASGATIRTVRAGRAYTVVVRDRATNHNFRLTGRGVSRATGLAFVGTTRWNVTFRAGTYTYTCDPHPSMRGTIRAI